MDEIVSHLIGHNNHLWLTQSQPVTIRKTKNVTLRLCLRSIYQSFPSLSFHHFRSKSGFKIAVQSGRNRTTYQTPRPLNTRPHNQRSHIRVVVAGTTTVNPTAPQVPLQPRPVHRCITRFNRLKLLSSRMAIICTTHHLLLLPQPPPRPHPSTSRKCLGMKPCSRLSLLLQLLLTYPTTIPCSR